MSSYRIRLSFALLKGASAEVRKTSVAIVVYTGIPVSLLRFNRTFSQRVRNERHAERYFIDLLRIRS